MMDSLKITQTSAIELYLEELKERLIDAEIGTGDAADLPEVKEVQFLMKNSFSKEEAIVLYTRQLAQHLPSYLPEPAQPEPEPAQSSRSTRVRVRLSAAEEQEINSYIEKGFGREEAFKILDRKKSQSGDQGTHGSDAQSSTSDKDKHHRICSMRYPQDPYLYGKYGKIDIF